MKEDSVVNLDVLQRENNMHGSQKVKEMAISQQKIQATQQTQPQKNTNTNANKEKKQPKSNVVLSGWLIIGPLLLGLFIFGDPFGIVAAGVIFAVGYGIKLIKDNGVSGAWQTTKDFFKGTKNEKVEQQNIDDRKYSQEKSKIIRKEDINFPRVEHPGAIQKDNSMPALNLDGIQPIDFNTQNIDNASEGYKGRDISEKPSASKIPKVTQQKQGGNNASARI